VSAATAEAAAAVDDSYAAIPACNWSSLKNLGVSPLYYRWRLAHPEPRKQAFVFGGAVHTLLLEPEKFNARYGVFDGTRRGKEWDHWQAINPGVESLKPAELERVEACVEAVRAHRVAAKLLSHGRREEVVTWTDEVTGLACKGRLDWIRPDLIVDLKTTRDPAPPKFERATASYGYAAQVAMYHDGAVAARLIPGDERPYLIAVKSAHDHDVAVFQLTPEALEAGRRIYRGLMRKLIECTEADYWPGVAPDLVQLELPPWAEGHGIANEETDEEW
jgi:hypothetical protein